MNEEILTPGLRRRLAQIEERYDELGKAMSDPATTSDPHRIREVGQELARVESLAGEIAHLRGERERIRLELSASEVAARETEEARGAEEERVGRLGEEESEKRKAAEAAGLWP